MKPVLPLKLGSIAFAILWSAWMVWWSGNFGMVNVIMLTVSGGVAAVIWFFAMRWYFRRIGLLPKA
ncbi:MAG: hypothetical protein U1E61_14130 [Bradyrhizobium sp.]